MALTVIDMYGSASQNSSLILVQTETIPEIPLMFFIPFFRICYRTRSNIVEGKTFRLTRFTFEILEELQQPYMPSHKSLPNKHQLQVKKNGS